MLISISLLLRIGSRFDEFLLMINFKCDAMIRLLNFLWSRKKTHFYVTREKGGRYMNRRIFLENLASIAYNSS